MRKHQLSLFLFGIVFLTGYIYYQHITKKIENLKKGNFTKSDFYVGLDVPDTLSFCGEKVPLNDPEVRERLDKELYINTYWQSQTSLILKRAPKFLPQIERVLAENQLPDDLKYLAVIESRLENVVSHRGATGYWQLMEGTAKELGLEVRDDIDQRYDLTESTEAACKYLKKSYKRFNNWTLVAASYNMGMGGVRYMLRKQNLTNFYDLKLNEQTSRYVFRALAFKLIMENPEKYHFKIPPQELYEEEKLIAHDLDSSVQDVVEFAKGIGVTYKTLRYYNPWIRDYRLKLTESDTFTLLLPAKSLKPNGFFASDTVGNYNSTDTTTKVEVEPDTLSVDSVALNNHTEKLLEADKSSANDSL